MRAISTVVVLALASLASAACVPPKVMIDHSYASADKSIETFIQRSGGVVTDGDNKTRLFNVYMRVCNQDASNTMTVCKDSLVLSNVDPGSI